MSLVSIIVPNYNHDRYLGQRLDSIFNQTYQDFEVIILDDASTDNSVDLLSKYKCHPKVAHFIVNEKNSGSPFKQWSKGLVLAKGKYIWIAESDDWADESFLEVMLNQISKDENLGFVYCRSHRTNDKGEPNGVNIWGEQIDPEIWSRHQSFEKKEFVNKYLRFRNIIPNVSAVLFRKEKIAIDEDVIKMELCGDWMLYSKIAVNSAVGYVSDPLNYFRRHAAATTFKGVSISKEKKRIREYLRVIRFNLNISGNRLSDSIDQYSWIAFGWINNRTLRKKFPISFFFPNLPLPLFICFYKIGIKKILNG